MKKVSAFRQTFGPIDLSRFLISRISELNLSGLDIFPTVPINLLGVDAKASVLLELGPTVNPQTEACGKFDKKQPDLRIHTQIVVQGIAYSGYRSDVNGCVAGSRYEPRRSSQR